MIKIFTPNDVIRYFYNETSPEENEAIANALIIDNDLLEVYREVKQSVEMLNDIRKEPSESVINNILNYSKSRDLNSVC
ncbi:hypothetical protein QQ020_30185 [Fulvivirgaceae bacterium BMA12]|uniref:Uncharacterized protein n=1 Tax=Agaribacillus aureus TaxID=3051825 RepID=A0ABT8LGR0_9BACT|nr:hypothetical protein [Fulvivirgaceae bacterium BMA12]